MLASGVSQRRVARILNVSQSVICGMLNHHLTHGDPSQRHGEGRDRATTQRQDRFLLNQSRRQRFSNAASLDNEFRDGTGLRFSTQTVKNSLQEFGLNARRPAIPLALTRQHLQDRIDTARTHVRWTISDWTPVLFTESRLCFDFNDSR